MVAVAGVFCTSPEEQSNEKCPNNEDYSPCQCFVFKSYYSLTCDKVPLANVSNIFKRTTPVNWIEFDLGLTISDFNKTIPANFLGNHTAKFFRLYCPAAVQQKQNFLIKIHPNAFRTPKSVDIERYYSSSFEIEGCDISQWNLNFFSGFHRFVALHIINASNFHLANWTSMPPLPYLSHLYIAKGAKDLNQWITFPNLSVGLQGLHIFDCEINDAAMDRILNWALKTSANTLESLDISGNNLAKVPHQMSSFKKIRSINLSKQKTTIPSLSANGSFAFPKNHSISFISAAGNRIASIQPGAFQGFLFQRIKNNNLIRKYSLRLIYKQQANL